MFWTYITGVGPSQAQHLVPAYADLVASSILEMAKHKDFTVATDVKVYFCDPQSPWQRGSNENTNGLLRQYFPKNADLTSYSLSDLNKARCD